MRRTKYALAVAAVAGLVATVGAYAAGGRTQADTLTIGASMTLTGPLGPFGAPMTAGYQQAIDEINAKGGLSLGGKTYKLKLAVLDNKSDPNLAATQARTLILQQHAVALLGSISPPIDVPLSNVADQLHKPLISTSLPIRAWLAARVSHAQVRASSTGLAPN